MDAIAVMPVKDSPIIFGLHPYADLNYRLNESIAMLTTLVDTQPKEASGGSGKSREDEVREKIEKELLPQLPPDFIEANIEERLKALRGPKGLSKTGKGIPLNEFIFKEF
jgi:dynein heavy chain